MLLWRDLCAAGELGVPGSCPLSFLVTAALMRSEGIDFFFLLHSICITRALVLRDVHTDCVSNWLFAAP